MRHHVLVPAADYSAPEGECDRLPEYVSDRVKHRRGRCFA